MNQSVIYTCIHIYVYVYMTLFVYDTHIYDFITLDKYHLTFLSLIPDHHILILSSFLGKMQRTDGLPRSSRSLLANQQSNESDQIRLELMKDDTVLLCPPEAILTPVWGQGPG